jgi:hypothetical protein
MIFYGIYFNDILFYFNPRVFYANDGSQRLHTSMLKHDLKATISD